MLVISNSSLLQWQSVTHYFEGHSSFISSQPYISLSITKWAPLPGSSLTAEEISSWAEWGQLYAPLGFTLVNTEFGLCGLVYKTTCFLRFVKCSAYTVMPFPLILICCWGNAQFTNHIIIKILLSPSTNLVNHTCNLILNQEALESDSRDSL